MEIYQFFKTNIAGQGYSRIWVEKPSKLLVDEVLLDELLPSPTQRLEAGNRSLPIAYTAKKLGETQIFLGIGLQFPNSKDEYGRQGLYFWHGVITALSSDSRDSCNRISALLLGLIRRYEYSYVHIQKNVSSLAEADYGIDWTDSIANWVFDVDSALEPYTQDLIDNFEKILDRISHPSNFDIRYPFHSQLAIPLLITTLIQRNEVYGIAGGAISKVSPDQFQHISDTLGTHPQYGSLRILDLINASSGISETRNSENTSSEGCGASLKVYGLMALSALLGILLLSTLLFSDKRIAIRGNVLDESNTPINAQIMVNEEPAIQNSPSGFTVTTSSISRTIDILIYIEN